MRPTRAFERVTVAERFTHLAAGRQVLAVADESRAAALGFVSSARYGWGKRELATWLVEHYAAAMTRPCDRGVDRWRDGGAASERFVEDADVARIVARARRHAIERVTTAWSTWRSQGFAREMIDAGYVVGVTDSTDALGYAAVDRPAMRLADRVLSLFLADFLTRPNDYESLVVCESCSEVSFRWDEIHEEGCSDRGPASGIIVKRPRFTRLGLGTGR